ncbi:hypothetical protein [Archangium primigenium]|nr:hypothetical protein [Archangium primigenium]MBM7118834.1 hypothetical protein [Archangium primigenium]
MEPLSPRAALGQEVAHFGLAVSAYSPTLVGRRFFSATGTWQRPSYS